MNPPRIPVNAFISGITIEGVSISSLVYLYLARVGNYPKEIDT